ncbi:NUDIX domain protein [Metarhizium album ARSEF 1941]|uniref:NUDIX domain protein n=1 Tax=Metarhizium album (strain ARSEF 1941) TaxID=1081103 RepID=A0A0B2WNG8_METAS|nr:NUDIX domain protein [Metarhizium album ARSEF 1941]KHN97601.1 NUDIX domain protein [Metarhizium album ARSEF 1941]
MAGSYTVSAAIPPSLQCPPSQFLSARPHVQRLMAAAMVFRAPAPAQMLLLRRAPSDTYPLRWEVPGGTTSDRKDGSVLDGVRRELWEETGLRARGMLCVVGMAPPGPGATGATGSPGGAREAAREEAGDDARTVTFWEPDGGRGEGRLRWGKVTVVVDVHEDLDGGGVVRLDEREHDRWAWATRAEVEAGRWADGEEIGFVSEGGRRSILEGFRVYEEREGEETGETGETEGKEEEEEEEEETDAPRLMAKFGGKANKGP